MNRRAWVRLDNASSMFLAALSDTDPKVFRMTAEMDHDVDPELLQTALDMTFDRYPLYHSVLRRGVFWYYLQDSDLRPTVAAENEHTCASIYQADVRTLLFRVVYHRRRINLEVFHALSDGTGALWFLTDLLREYVALASGERSVHASAAVEDPLQLLEADSFSEHFRTGTHARVGEKPARNTERRGLGRFVGASTAKAYRARGTRTPDNRTRLVEATMPVVDVLALARHEQVSLTSYLTALFFQSIRAAGGAMDEAKMFGASVPVNLRQLFPSTSARNFFTTVRLEHTYDAGHEDLGIAARNLDVQLRQQTTAHALRERVERFMRFESMIVLRIVPVQIKNVMLGLLNRASNRGLSVAVSNLGNIRLPEQVAAHVTRMFFHVSAVRPQFCAVSCAGQLTVSFTSPFIDTDHVREFVRFLTARGVPVQVAASRVTDEEIQQGSSDPR